MMAPLQLELIKPITPPLLRLTWLGAALFILGTVFFIFAWQSYLSLLDKQIEADNALQVLAISSKENKKQEKVESRTQVNPNELNAIKSTVNTLLIPWNDLFNTLEEAETRDVVLLDFEPDSKKNSVVISGEAKNYSSIIAYIDALENQAALAEVYLRKHLVVESDQDRPVHFSLVARWVTTGSGPSL